MAIITYDVSGKQPDVKAEMKKLGYSDNWTHAGQLYSLPETTLWKSSAEVQAALSDIQSVATNLGVRVERAVALPHAGWTAIPGLPHSRS